MTNTRMTPSRITLYTAALLLALAAPWPVAWAGAARLDGTFAQGGLVHGTAAPGTRVTLNGRAVRVSPAGRFVFGFGYDAPATATFQAVAPDGAVERRTLAIAKRVYKEQRIDGLPPKMVTPPDSVLARIHADAALIAKARAVDRPEPLFESGFIWPVTGPITGVFGSRRILNGKPRRPHFGVDIAAPAGTPVKAAADGVVAVASTDMYYTGGTVLLDHGYGLTTVYSHMKEVRVRAGTRVRQGDVIGAVGATGRATGPHLDWRINWFDQRLDPAGLVPPMPASASQ